MNYAEHKITLDVHKTVEPVSLKVKKGDTGRRLLIHLAERGYPYHLSPDCYAVFTAQKPDGKVVFNECTIEDCVIIYDFTEQTVAAEGLMDCEIILYGSDGKQLTSASFNIIVEDTIYDAETEIESTNEYNALAALIAQMQAIKALGTAAPAIVCKAAGEQISVSDASVYPLQGLRICGKSTQDGTPTPDSPVEIVSLSTPIVVTVTDGSEDNMQAMTITAPGSIPGIPVASGGNYTDGDGQQWICDEIDLGRGVYVQRVYRETVDGSKTVRGGQVLGTVIRCLVVTSYEPLVSDCVCNKLPFLLSYSHDSEHGYMVKGSGYGAYVFINTARLASADIAGVTAYLTENPVEILYALATPIETELTAADILAFAGLHTYKTNTTIYNDTGAYMAAEYVADTKTYIDNKNAAYAGTIAWVTLLASAWVGSDNLYSQVVAIDGVTENSQVNLTPSVEQLSIFYEKDITFVTENDGGVVTVYVIGQKPQNDYIIQADIVEVSA